MLLSFKHLWSHWLTSCNQQLDFLFHKSVLPNMNEAQNINFHLGIIICIKEGLFHLERIFFQVFLEQFQMMERVGGTHYWSRGFPSPTVNFSAGALICHALNSIKNLCQNMHLWQLTVPKLIRGCKCAYWHHLSHFFPSSHPVTPRGTEGGHMIGSGEDVCKNNMVSAAKEDRHQVYGQM